MLILSWLATCQYACSVWGVQCKLCHDAATSHQVSEYSFSTIYLQQAILRNFMTFSFTVVGKASSMCPNPQSEYLRLIRVCLGQIGPPKFSLQAAICYLDIKVCAIPRCPKQSVCTRMRERERVCVSLFVCAVCIAVCTIQHIRDLCKMSVQFCPHKSQGQAARLF